MKKIFLLPLAFCFLPLKIASAQSPSPTCQPPRQGEYLVLVNQTSTSQEQIQRTLPPNIKTSMCRYFEDMMTRIGGFKTLDDANSWARYVNEIVGLSAFVAQGQAQTLPGTLAYNPKPLGAGYAVLVDYFNQPEAATQVRQLLGTDVGLVAYGQRPYLLAVYSDDQKKVNSTLQKLSNRGFFAMLVDSRKVMLLKAVVSL